MIKFNEKGLIPAIAQDSQTGTVLMVAWMNEEALKQTIKNKKAVYFSRSRNKLWVKGEESGHFQEIVEICIDCDADVILLKVRQKGLACHTGHVSCFYRSWDDDKKAWIENSPVIKDPKEIYK